MTDAEIQDMRAELLVIAAELLLGAVQRPKWPAHLPTYVWTRVNNAWDKGDEKMKQYALRIRNVANRLHRIAELEQMLREARAGFDTIANKAGEPRWDLAKRIDTVLGDSHSACEQP